MPDSVEDQCVKPALLLGIAESLSVNPLQQVKGQGFRLLQS